MNQTPFGDPIPPGTPAAGIFQRAKDILLNPKEAWAAIDAEPATTQSIYVPYVLLLAAVGPIAQLIGGQVFGYNFFGVAFRPPLIGALTTALISYGMTLVTTYILSLVIDGLAPTFGGQKNQIQALKVAAYSATASWLAGIFGLIPALSILAIVGLYSLYLLYLGLPVLMKTPADKALGYTVVVILVAVALFFVVGLVVAAFAVTPTMSVRM